MKTTNITISREDIKHAQKEYDKWLNNCDDKIPRSVFDQIKNAILIVDAYESQVAKGIDTEKTWTQKDWIVFSVGNFIALKFRKALIKMWDKEFPEHLEEVLGAAKLILDKEFNYDFNKAAVRFDNKDGKPEQFSNLTATVSYDFTKSSPVTKKEEACS